MLGIAISPSASSVGCVAVVAIGPVSTVATATSHVGQSRLAAHGSGAANQALTVTAVHGRTGRQRAGE